MAVTGSEKPKSQIRYLCTVCNEEASCRLLHQSALQNNFKPKKPIDGSVKKKATRMNKKNKTKKNISIFGYCNFKPIADYLIVGRTGTVWQ